MNQESFIAIHAQQWQKLEDWLDGSPMGDASDLDFPRQYRQLCYHLALARSRLYSQHLIDRLGNLVLRAHQRLYRPRRDLREKLVRFVAAEFPALVRQQRHLVALSVLCFIGPLIGMLIWIQINPDIAYSVLDTRQIYLYETMYDQENQSRIGRMRESESDFLMFGFYIRNNTGIGFQTFAGGLLFGLGTLFYLIYNGLYIGSIAGYLTHIGSGTPFWSFVAGHSALELTAIVLSGTAGLMLGSALVRPGRKSRLRALRDNARHAIRIIYGAAALFFVAAFIEAFWSSIAWLPAYSKFLFGFSMWVIVLSYLLGRRT